MAAGDQQQIAKGARCALAAALGRLPRAEAALTAVARISRMLTETDPKAIDRAESLVFEVAQHRQTDSMSRLHDLLDQTLDSLAKHFRVSTGTPWKQLPEKVKKAILHGTGLHVAWLS